MARQLPKGSEFECSGCGWRTPKWAGRCGRCGKWDALAAVSAPRAGQGGGLGQPTRLRLVAEASGKPEPIGSVDASAVAAWPTGIGEFDRVLGGGIVPGSVVLLAGDPGVGKSTLLLDVAARAARDGRRVLYATGEETAAQVRLRADRIGALAPDLFLLSTGDLSELLRHVDDLRPDLVFVDSVQTLSAAGLDGVPGGVAHVREVTGELVAAAKARNIAVVLVGHVTKDGTVAGPRTLEHLVDVVCSFEGDTKGALRMLRASKNRYGSAEEIGCFELGDAGLREVSDPSGLFVRHEDWAFPGTAIGVALEGRRPVAVEIQALVAPSALASPRRTTSGVDSSRLAMCLATLQRRARIPLATQDVYVSTVGGARGTEPALDGAIVVACASAHWDIPAIPGTVVVGEVGLTGEMLKVRGARRRLAEAARLGFTRAVVPPGTLDVLADGNDAAALADLEVLQVPNVAVALGAALDRELASEVFGDQDGD